MAPADPFATPHNWCDRLCERCPLADTCGVPRREAQRRWVYEARGVDPNSPEAFRTNLAEVVGQLETLAEEVAEEMGKDLDAIEAEPPPPVSLAAERLRRGGSKLMRSLPDDPPVDVMKACFTLGTKGGRIGPHLDSPLSIESGVWDADAVPNLLLVEHVISWLRDAVAGIDDLRATAAEIEALARIYAPHIAAIAEEPRSHLAALIEAGEAPSPFCQVDRSDEE